MKTQIILYIFMLLFIIRFSFADTPVPPGDVSGTWTKENSPYLINGEITIPYGSTLTVEPGVLVEFQGYYPLNVQGRLLAIGTENDTIVFTIHDTTGFNNPDTTTGGWHGIRFFYTSSANDSSKIIYCKLQYGKAIGPSWPDNDGGAIFILNFHKLLISHCLFEQNMAFFSDEGGGFGGAIRICDNSNIILLNCKISKNSAIHGGAIMIWGINANPLIINCIINDNYVSNSGGGICCFDGGNPLIQNTTFSGNIATFGGAMNFYQAKPVLINNIIVNNQAEAGGGIVFNGNSDITSINNTICNNNVSSGGGGIICHEDSDPILINTILYGNTASWDSQVHLWSSTSVPSFYHCDVQGGVGKFPGENNINVDPLFETVGDNAYCLSDASPCISGGLDSIEIDENWYYAPAADIEGNPRPDPVGTIPDIGAYESPLGYPESAIDEQEILVPLKFALEQNYPNPFNPITMISYQLPKTSEVELSVYNLLGQKIATLIHERQSAGKHIINYNASNLSSGIYIYKIEAGSYVKTKKMILLK